MSLDDNAVEAADPSCGLPARLTPAQAAALALEPMTDAQCAAVGRVLADIEGRRRSRSKQHAEAA